MRVTTEAVVTETYHDITGVSNGDPALLPICTSVDGRMIIVNTDSLSHFGTSDADDHVPLPKFYVFGLASWSMF